MNIAIASVLVVAALINLSCFTVGEIIYPNITHLRGKPEKPTNNSIYHEDYVSFQYLETIPKAYRLVFEDVGHQISSLIKTKIEHIVDSNYLIGLQNTNYSFFIPKGAVLVNLTILVVTQHFNKSVGTLGTGAPSKLGVTSPKGHLIPSIGAIRINRNHLDTMFKNKILDDVIRHEIIHVLGFGTVWGTDLVDGEFPNQTYIGKAGVRGYNSIGGHGNSIPLGHVGQPVEQMHHWSDRVFDNEIMTSLLNVGSTDGTVNAPLSLMTVMAFEDLGYDVNRDSPLIDYEYKIPSNKKRKLVSNPGSHDVLIERQINLSITELSNPKGENIPKINWLPSLQAEQIHSHCGFPSCSFSTVNTVTENSKVTE